MKTRFAGGMPTIKEISEMCSGRLICSGTAENATVAAICTDSREADAETLFCAIVGENTDGHNYIVSTIKKGCPFVLASVMPDMSGIEGCSYAIVLVEDTVAALGEIAREYKKRFDCVTVGVTGSVGKTTTKEFIATVLSERFKTFKTEGNHNSVIGMPLSVIEIEPDTGAAVLEMGMSGFGEISSMTKAARPDIAVITTVGTSHMEQLGSRENICRAKMEIAEGLDKDGLIILNGDEPLLVSADKGGRRVLYVGIENRDADLRALNIRSELTGTTFDLLMGGRIYTDIEIPVMGQHNVYAALFAFSVGKRCGMDIEEIRRGLLNYKSVGMRQNIYELGGITLIEDCYNASPESMRAAIDLLGALAEQKNGARSVALLGDMLELGENSPALHRNVGSYLASSGCGVLFTYGERAEDIALAAIKGGMSPENVYVNPRAGTPEVTGEMMLHALRAGDVLLVKASRSVAAEKVIEFLKDNTDKLPK